MKSLDGGVPTDGSDAGATGVHRSALRDGAFLRLLTSQSLSSFGDSALLLALGIWVKDLTGSTAAAGAVFLSFTAPTLLAPLVGYVVDLVSRRVLMLVVNAIAAGVVCTLVAVHSRHEIWLIYAVAVVYGFVLSGISTAPGALLRDMLSDEALVVANASFQTITQAIRVVSPIAGAGLYSALGGGVLAIIDACTFVVAAATLLTMPVRELDLAKRTDETFTRQVIDGFTHIRATPILFRIVAAVGVAFLVVGLYETVDFAVVDQGLHRHPSFLGFLLSVKGLGSVFGGFTAAVVVRRLGEARAVAIAMLLWGIFELGLTTTSLAIILTALTVMGAAIAWLVVGAMTALQLLTPPRLQGRVGATMSLLVEGPQTVSIAAGAALITVVDYRVLVLVMTVVVAGAGAALLAVQTASARPEPTRVASRGARR